MIIDIDDLKKQLNSTVASEVLAAEKDAIALLEQGNLEAADLLISAYAEGAPLIRPDRIKEFKYTKMAADLGSDFCRYWLAKLQHGSKDYAGAIENATRAHEKGIPYAATLLGKMMLAGEGQPAKPLDALQILSDSVDKDENTDAALLIAQVYMEDKVVPRNAQGAYDILQRLAAVFERSAPALRADYLAFKAESIRLGAAPGPGESYERLISQAADLGNESAVIARGKLQTNALERELKAEWDSIAGFRATGMHWKMFTELGTLKGLTRQSRSVVTTSSNGIDSTTKHTKLATLATRSGREFNVTIPVNGNMTIGRHYAVVYVGPADSDDGVPGRIHDLETGAAIKTDSNPLWTYNLRPLDRLFGLFCVTLGLPLFILVWTGEHWFETEMGFVLGLVAVAVIGTKLFMRPFKGYRKAMADAGAFFAKHRDKLR